MYKGCPRCGNNEIEQITQGHAVSKVWGISCDDKIICDGHIFKPHKHFPTVYRCKKCLEPIEEKLFNPNGEVKEVKESNEQGNDKKHD